MNLVSIQTWHHKWPLVVVNLFQYRALVFRWQKMGVVIILIKLVLVEGSCKTEPYLKSALSLGGKVGSLETPQSARLWKYVQTALEAEV